MQTVPVSSREKAKRTPDTPVGDAIFLYDDPVAFLNAQLEQRRRMSSNFSLRSWSSEVGYRNPSMLFQVLRRQRTLKMDLAAKLATSLRLKGNALRYFELLVLKTNSKSEQDRRVLDASLTKLRPNNMKDVKSISLEVFSLASEWYHSAILGLMDLPDFSADPAWLQARLGKDLDKRTLRAAVDRLIRLGFLAENENGVVAQADPSTNHIMLENKIPSTAVRQYHAQMIEKSRLSIEQQTVEERHLEATTIVFNKRHLAKAAAIIHAAHSQLLELSKQECADANELYQINSQVFRLSTKAKGAKT